MKLKQSRTVLVYLSINASDENLCHKLEKKKKFSKQRPADLFEYLHKSRNNIPINKIWIN